MRHAWAQWEADEMATMKQAIKEAFEQSAGALSKEVKGVAVTAAPVGRPALSRSAR